MSIALSASAATLDRAHREFGGEKTACLGVDVHAARETPDAELVRLYWRADDDLAPALDLILGLLRTLEPCVEGFGQQIRIRHDGEDAAIIVSRIPGHADGGDGRSFDVLHHCSFDDALNRARRDGVRAAGFDAIISWPPAAGKTPDGEAAPETRRHVADFIVACIVSAALAIAAFVLMPLMGWGRQ